MKKLLLGVFLTLSVSLFSQFEAQLSQYMLNNGAYNPAAVGESDLIDIVFMHRFNMISMPSGGSTTFLNVNSPLKFGKGKHGVGVNLMKDEVGWLTNETYSIQYAYKTKIADGHLSIGAEFGSVNLGFSGDSVAQHTIKLGTYHISGDDAIPQTNTVGSGFDMGLGVFYTLNNWYAGASFRHLNKPTVKWGINSEYRQPGVIYATGGFYKKLDNPKYLLKPSFLVKSDFTKVQVDLSSRLEYDNKFWGGLTFRPLSSVVFLAGAELPGGLSAGVSFDVPTSRLVVSRVGSLEVMVSYSFEYVFTKQNSKYKSIRYL